MTFIFENLNLLSQVLWLQILSFNIIRTETEFKLNMGSKAHKEIIQLSFQHTKLLFFFLAAYTKIN